MAIILRILGFAAAIVFALAPGTGLRLLRLLILLYALGLGA